MELFGRRLFILIADDNRDLAWTLALLSRLAGFDVETVHDGREVLRAVRARRPDFLLLDIGLPGMDGFQVAEQIKGEPACKKIIIIAISAYAPDMFPGRSMRAGFDHHLVKPVDFQTLISLLARLHRAV
jgi:two-component system CheB/CheR fusion protein